MLEVQDFREDLSPFQASHHPKGHRSDLWLEDSIDEQICKLSTIKLWNAFEMLFTNAPGRHTARLWVTLSSLLWYDDGFWMRQKLDLLVVVVADTVDSQADRKEEHSYVVVHKTGEERLADMDYVAAARSEDSRRTEASGIYSDSAALGRRKKLCRQEP